MDLGDAGTAPRVNGASLANYIGRTVSLVGTVESQMPTAVVLRASDGGVVHVKPIAGSDYSSKIVEVIGRAVDGQTLEQMKVTHFSDNFDMDNYNQLVHLAHTKFKPLFD